MLLRNTIVGTMTFVCGLGVMWVLVERFGISEVLASGASFVFANSVHYVLGRSWVFKGTDRGVASGYAIFLANGAIGLGLTMGLMALFVSYTSVHYLVARVLVSIVAGLAVFVLNGVVTFRRL